MGRRKSSSLSTRPRPERARRRVVFSAETLESRHLLSVAALPPTMTPAVHAPALIGSFSPTPTTAPGTPGSFTGSTSGYQIVLEFNPSLGGEFSFHGFTETILIIEEPSTVGSAAGPTAPAGGSSSPTGAGSTGTSSGSSEASSAASITPLNATILNAQPANRGPIIAVITAQPVLTNFTTSTMPVTTQAILATATLEEQPIAPPVLGQGFESGQTQGLDPRADAGFSARPTEPIPEPMHPAIDVIEPYRPALDEAQPAQPSQPAEPPPAPAPVREIDPVQAISIEPAALADWDQAPDFPVLSPRSETRTEAETPTWSMAAVVGTAAIAGGGYHLVLGGSNRFNQRWIPARRSSKPARGRKSTLA